MPFCSKCGAELRPNAKFCHKCGTEVTRKTPTEGYYFEMNGKQYKLKDDASPSTRTYILDEDKVVIYDAGHELNFYFYSPMKKGRYVAVQADLLSTWCASMLEYGPGVYSEIRTYELIFDDSLLKVTPKPEKFTGVYRGMAPAGSSLARDLIFQRMQEKLIPLSRAQKEVLRNRLIEDQGTPISLVHATPSVKSFFAELEPIEVPVIPEAEDSYRFDFIDYSREDAFDVMVLMMGGVIHDGLILSGEGQLHASTIEFVGSPTIRMSYQVDDGSALPLRLTPSGGVALLDTTKLSDGEHKLAVQAVDSQNRQAVKSVKVVIKNKR